MRGIGYVRVSSVDQNPARQFQQLNKIGMDIIFEEKLSGATQERPELQKMFESIQQGDIIFVTDLTRIRGAGGGGYYGGFVGDSSTGGGGGLAM